VRSSAIVCCVLLLASPAASQEPDLRDRATARSWLQAALDAPLGPPSISVAVAVGDEVVLAEAVGFADLQGQVQATPQTTYRVYSISKGITAVAVMQLVSEGLLDLNADIRTYVPGFPEKRWPIRPIHLIAHTSGIRHYKPDAGEISSTIEFPSLAASLVVFANDPLAFEPGTNERYSSFGFNLLTGAIESASGGSFEQYLENSVFEPAGMARSSVAVAGREDTSLAKPYWRPRKESEPNWPIDEIPNLSGRYGSSGIVSTPTDLVKLFIAMRHGEFLSPDVVEQMYSPPFPDIDAEQAHGWNLEVANGRLGIYRSGAGTGYTGALIHYPAEGVSAALLTNQNQFKERWEILETLAAAFLDKRE